MSTATLTLEKDIKWADMKQFFNDIPSDYEQRNVKVIVFLTQDEEDIEIQKNQKNLKKQMQESSDSGRSSFSI